MTFKFYVENNCGAENGGLPPTWQSRLYVDRAPRRHLDHLDPFGSFAAHSGQVKIEGPGNLLHEQREAADARLDGLQPGQ